MRKTILFIILTFLLTGVVTAHENPYLSYVDMEKTLPEFGTRPWEHEMKINLDMYTSSVKRSCELSQIEVNKEKARIAEEKRKAEEARRKEEARKAEEKRKAEELQRINQQQTETGYAFKGDGTTASKAVEVALKHVGLRYTRSNTSWNNGVDCGNLIRLSYRDVGIKVPGSTDKYLNGEVGKSIAIEGKDGLKNAKPGDVLVSVQTKWFRTHHGGKYTHVALYIGNGKMVHANTPRGVHVANVAPRFKKSMIHSIRRVVE